MKYLETNTLQLKFALASEYTHEAFPKEKPLNTTDIDDENSKLV